MTKKIYFSGSISGGRDDVKLYSRIINKIKEKHIVLDEHIGDVNYSIKNRDIKDEQAIYKKDTDMLKEADLVIAECSTPSLGVGYEMAYAEKLNKIVYIFCKKQRHLSAMLSGNPYFNCYLYENEDELISKIEELLND